jgi:2'-5' RNA ligase
MITDRLFFAIRPDAVAASRILELQRQLIAERGLKGRPISRERLHITLHFLGNFEGLPEDLLSRARNAAADVRAPAFDVALDCVTSFARDRNRPYVLLGDSGTEQLQAFQETLVIALQRAGVRGMRESKARGYVPHVTLTYDDAPLPRRMVEPVMWTAREFVLVQSYIGRGRHQVLGQWPLPS